MKFDAVTPYDCTYPREVASKDIGHNDEHIMVLKLKADVEPEREAKHDIASPIESRSYEQTDPAQYVNNPFVEFEDSVKAYQNQFDYAKASYIGKIDLTTEVTESCAGNGVTETELPETIDGACHTVKDICIDDGIQSAEKVLVENSDQNLLYRVNDSLSTVNFCLTKGMVDDIDPISYGLISSSINENPVRGSSGSTLLQEVKSASVAPSKEIRDKQLLPLQELVTETWEVDSSSFNNIKDQKQSTATQQMDKGTLEEENSTTKILPSAVEEAIQSIGTKESPIGEVGVIKLHFDSGVATSDTEESKENTNQESGSQRRSSLWQSGVGRCSCKGADALTNFSQASPSLTSAVPQSEASVSGVDEAQMEAPEVDALEWFGGEMEGAPAEEADLRISLLSQSEKPDVWQLAAIDGLTKRGQASFASPLMMNSDLFIRVAAAQLPLYPVEGWKNEHI